jgi:chloramphenicol O-acetyltransferase type A
MEEINIDTWERKEHFNFFLRGDLPFYNVNFHVDITGLRDYVKAYGLSLNNTLIFLVTKTLNRIDNFRYRLVDGKVIKYERINPSFACIRGNEELFRMITVEFIDDLVAFDRKVKEEIKNSNSYFDFRLLNGRTDFVFISTLPWIPFTGIDHTLSLRKEDAIPRISWGKYFEQDGKVLLPFNIQVNHIFVDGLHVGKFYQLLHEEVRGQINASLEA